MDIGANGKRRTDNTVDALERIGDSEDVDEVFIDDNTEQEP